MEVHLRGIPEDLWRVIVREQAREKVNKGINQYSLSATVIKIIREWEQLKKSGK